MAVNTNGPATGFPNQGAVSGAGIVGVYATAAALETAKPAASNTNNLAAVGSAAPYLLYASNGTAWVLFDHPTNYEVATWADLPDPTTVVPGRTYTVRAGLMTGGATGTRWQSNGTLWRPAGAQVLIHAATQVDGVSGGVNTEQFLFSPLFPAGALRGVRLVRGRVKWVFSASDAVARSVRWRLGTAGTTADTIIASNDSAVAASARVVIFPFMWLRSSDTTWRYYPHANNTGSALVSPDAYFTTGSAYAGDITIPSLTQALYLSATVLQAGGGIAATCSVQFADIFVE